MQEELAAGGFDVVVADFLVAEPNLPAAVGAPIVLFAHNVEFQIWKRLAAVESRWWRRIALEGEWRKMRRRERLAVTRAATTIAVSAEDRDMLQQLVPEARIDVVPTGVDTEYFAPLPRALVRHRLVFSGSMDWYPNEDAILSFAHEVWPKLRHEFPDVSMTVVGRNPGPKLVSAAEACGITVTGTVADVRPYLAEAEVYVVPLRVGGGTRLKIFEALAMGKAVVSTTIGAEGLGLTPGRHFVAADGADQLAASIARLLRDDSSRSRLARDGSEFVRSRYGWSAVTAAFADTLDDAVASHAATTSGVTSAVSV